MNFSKRSYQNELLDQDNIPFADIKQNLQELDFINTWLGGHKITVGAFKALTGRKTEILVCEIGCGGGDNLVAIYRFCQKRKLRIRLIGIDIKEECISYAKARSLPKDTQWIVNDYKQVIFDTNPDIIFSSLFCHHFREEELLFQIAWMKRNSLTGFFINDLHRNFLAYFSIKLLTTIFSKSYLVKNDAPLSVARGFSRKELKNLCAAADAKEALVLWKWAFRFVIIYKHDRAGKI